MPNLENLKFKCKSNKSMLSTNRLTQIRNSTHQHSLKTLLLEMILKNKEVNKTSKKTLKISLSLSL